MTWNCSDCESENSDENIWCPDCGTVHECEFCGEPVQEATRDLKRGGEQTVIECPNGDTKYRF